jgi:hypothetical protein
VAAAEEDRLVIEIAPSRFAELPTALIIPMHCEIMRKNLRFDLARLRAGDIVALELVVPRGGVDEFIPRFRIHGVSFGQRRHFETAFTLPLHRDDVGTPFVGFKSRPLFAAPAFEDYVFEDYVFDLRQIANTSDRNVVLQDLFMHYGERLVLEGEAVSSIRTEQGIRCFIDIGILVPIRLRGRMEMRQPSRLFSASEATPSKGALCYLRILNVNFEGDILSVFRFEASVGSEASCIISGSYGNLRRCHQRRPNIGDAVLIQKGANGAYCIAGFPFFDIVWIPDDNDALRLHDAEHCQVVLSELLRLPGSFLWVTVESIDNKQRVIRLTRRLQIARSLPNPGFVVQACVMGVLDRSHILVDLGGLPWTLAVNEFCYGAPNLKELCAGDEKEGGLRGGHLEVVRKSDGHLSAIAVYDELPMSSELETTIVNCTPSGVVVITRGQRIFVPKSELAWCDLNAEQIKELFGLGERLMVSLGSDGDVRFFSHVQTHSIRTEFASLLRKANEPVYVHRMLDDKAKNRVIVRGRSKVLMELVCQPGVTVGDRICAYVRRIDSRRHRVELSLDSTPLCLWHLPQIRKMKGHEAIAFAADILSDEVVKASLEDLQQAVTREGTSAITAWISRQVHLEPSPRNLRLTIERLHTSLGGAIPWAEIAESQSDANGGVQTAFQEILPQIAGVLAKRVKPENVSPIARFAVGYFYLITGQEQDAAVHLNTAWEDDDLQQHFDVGLSMARAIFFAPGNGKRRATLFLRSLTVRFFASALGTIMPPLLGSERLELDECDRAKFAAAIAAGDVNALEGFLLQKYRVRNPYSSLARSNEVWFLLVKARIGPEFDRAVDNFFEALQYDVNIGLPVDGRLYMMAALLSFARGDVAKGWWYLDRVNHLSHPDLHVVFFWRAWLSDERGLLLDDEPITSAVGRLLTALWHTWRQCRWREEINSRSFDTLWEAFKNSSVRWIIGKVGVRPIPLPPSSRDDLVQWVRDWGAEVALRPLLAERGLDEFDG